MSEKNNKYTPNLRFPEFSGEWEEKNINDCFEFKQGVQCPVDLQALQKKDGYIRFIRIIDLTQSGEPPRYIADPGLAHHICKEDLFMVRYGSPGLVGYGYEGVIANNLFRLLPKFDMCTKFFKDILTALHKNIAALCGIGALPAINFSTLGLLRISLPPTIAEQQKIASCLSAMDDLIAAQAEKVEALKEKKTGMMQQLFPQPGETTPRLRFPEFTGEWEEKTLGEVSPVIFDGTHQTPHYVNSGIPFYSIENIVSDKPCKYIAQDEHMSNTKKNKTEKGDILITRIGTIGFAKIVDWDGEFSTYVSLATIKKSSLINTRYLLGYLQSEVYQKEMRSKSLMNAVPCKINMEDLKNTRIAFPKEPKEQQKIASCLSALDDQIAAETEKLTALKDYKKGLMQQLLPQPAK